MGRCVSQWTHAAHQNRVSARSACSAEQADPNFAANHDDKSFAEFYGTGPKHRNAFGKCVSSKAKTASDQQKSNTLNAARSCKAERSSMEGPAFRAKYGKNANDRNAFGKCVSQLSKSTPRACRPSSAAMAARTGGTGRPPSCFTRLWPGAAFDASSGSRAGAG